MKKSYLLGVVACIFLMMGAGCNEEDQQKFKEAKPEKKSQKVTEEITVEGKLRVVGSSPFYELVVTTPEPKDYYLNFNNRVKAAEYMSFQYKQIKVLGTLNIVHLKTPDGKYTVTKNIIKVKQISVLE